jgi:uncharacterized protein with PIN domain
MTVKTCDFCGAVEHLPDHPFSTVRIADLKPRDACGPCIRALEKFSGSLATSGAKPKPRTECVCVQCGASYWLGDAEWHRICCPTGKGLVLPVSYPRGLE